jgi:hypothetical protein
MGRPQLGFPRLRVIVGRAAGITIGPDHTPPWRNMMRSCQTGNFARLPQSAVQRIGRELVHSVACAVNSVRVMAASPCGYRVHAALTSSSLLPCSNLGPACPLCCRYSFPACGCEYRQPNQFWQRAPIYALCGEKCSQQSQRHHHGYDFRVTIRAATWLKSSLAWGFLGVCSGRVFALFSS